MKHKNGKEKKIELFNVLIKEVDTEKARLTAVVSTKDEDRHGDVVLQDGWDLKNYKKNPVILNSHNYGDATEVVGKAVKTFVNDKGQLEQEIEFAVNQNPKAKIIFDLYAGGYLKAFSVGFMPLKFKDDDYSIIEKAELLEVSAVSVPANARALAKAKGIDIDILDEDNEDDTKTNEVPENNAPETTIEDDTTEDGGQGGSENGDGAGERTSEDPGNKSIIVRAKEFENWENGVDEIRFKLRDIAEFQDGTIERITYKPDMPRIYATVGTSTLSGRKDIQMMFFPKADGWTVDDARKWFIARQFQILENPAVPENDTAADVLDTDGSIPIEQRSKKDMLKKALVGLTEKDKERLKKARSVISVLLNGKSNVQDQQTQGKITMRKINQAIRILMEVKK